LLRSANRKFYAGKMITDIGKRKIGMGIKYNESGNQKIVCKMKHKKRKIFIKPFL
jgi:hypothetical protein